jgi:chemotaxis protein histidine kinase CheA
VRARGEPIVVPLTPIAQVIKIHPREVETREGEEVFVADGRTIPVVDLGSLLGLGRIDRGGERVIGVHIAG